MLQEHNRPLNELKTMVGSVGRRWDRDLEKIVLAIYRDKLLRCGIDLDKIRRFSHIDVDGKFGLKGSAYRFDIVIEDSGVTII
jgi:hypothetical protein